MTSASTRPARTALDAEVAPPTGRAYLRLVLVLGAMIAIGPLTIDMYLPALPALATDLGADDAAAQGTLTGMLVGLGIGQLLLGPVTDAVGRRRVLMAGLAGHAVASALCAVAPTVAALTLARGLQGAAGAAVSVVAMAVVRDLFSGHAAAVLLSRLMLVMGLAPVLAPSLGGVLLGLGSWRFIFAVLAAAAVVLLVVGAIGLPETLPPSRRRSAHPAAALRGYGVLLRDRTFVALVLVGGLMFATMFAYISGSPFVLQGVYGLDEQAYALAFAVNAVGIVGATQLNPLLLRRWSPRHVLTAGVVIGLLSSAVLVATTSTGTGGLVGVLVPLAVVVASCGLAFPNTPALALSRHGEAAGTASALLGAAQFGLGGLAAPLVGLLGTGSAAPMALVMLGSTSLALLLVVLVVRRSAADDMAADAAPAVAAAAH